MTMFETRICGCQDARPIVFLHGFMGSAADFSVIAEKLSDRFLCIGVDLPGHGSAALPDAELSMPELAESLRADVLEPLDRPALVGYSMGGRLALQTALDHPDTIEKLVLISTSPGLDDEDARRERRHKDRERAASIRADYDVFLDAWYRLPIFGALRHADRYPDMLERRRQNDPTAMARVICELSPGLQPSNWHKLDRLRDTTWLVGADDPKYAALGRKLADAGHDVIQADNAAHALHVERPEWLSEQLRCRL